MTTNREAIIEAAARALKDALHHVDDNPEAGDLIIEALAALPLIRAAALENEREEIAKQARRYAGHYKEGSDGRNTFIMLGEWIEARR